MAIVIACLAMAKPYYTLYYNFMIIIYFYLNQENCKTQGTTATTFNPTTTQFVNEHSPTECLFTN